MANKLFLFHTCVRACVVLAAVDVVKISKYVLQSSFSSLTLAAGQQHKHAACANLAPLIPVVLFFSSFVLGKRSSVKQN